MSPHELAEQIEALAREYTRAAGPFMRPPLMEKPLSELSVFELESRFLRTALAAVPQIVAALREAGRDEWQPIETAPRDGTRVLVWMEPVPDPRYIPSDGPMAVIASYVVWSEAMKREGMQDGWSWYGPVRCQPTHWRPLPTPPAPTRDAQ